VSIFIYNNSIVVRGVAIYSNLGCPYWNQKVPIVTGGSISLKILNNFF